MAQVNYNEGVSDVKPEGEVPNDYLSSRGADASAFGGQLAEGAEALGQGMLTSSKFFGRVAADDASNQFQDFATKLMHGDPSKSTPGPDGQPIPDTGYMGTKGRDTLDQRPHVSEAMDNKIKELRAGLQSPEQQLEFDNFTRRYRSMVNEKIGSHADGQATTWYSSVNTASAKLAMDHIANNFDKPNEVAAGFQDLTQSYVKNAQLSGARPGDPQYQEALESARRDGLQAQLNAMAVKDPSRALAVLDKNKDIAGVKYDDMARSFRSRAEQQQGFDIGEQALKRTYESQPASGYQAARLTQAGAPYGISGSYLQRTHQLENANDDTRENSAHAQGPFQFIPSTAARYGLKDRNDFDASAAAAAHLAADNRDALTNSLGRAPTDAELYLAHQQGAGGAAALLSHPNVRAGSLVGDAAIRQNGGDPNAPASAFTSLWTAKFNGAPGQAYAQRKASAYQTIMSDPNLDPAVRQHALTYVSQQIQGAQVADEQDAKATKARSDALQSQLVTKIIEGSDPNIITTIAHSGLPANEMENLYKFAVEQGGVPNTALYGPGYSDAFKQVMSSPDEPGHIADAATIIARGGPGGDLSKKGVTELLGVMEKIKKQPDQAGINTVKSAQLEYYKSQFAIDQNFNIPGMKPFKNQKGVDKFNHEFVPAFEAAYSDWVGKGKSPMEFLNNKEQLDGLMNRIYPASQRAADAMRGDDAGPEKPPAAPDGVEPKAWDRMMSSPPKLTNGQNVPLDKWANAINWLRDNPTLENRAAFDRKMGPSGYTSDYVLKRIPPKAGAVPESIQDTEGGPAAGFGGAFEPKKPLMERIPQTLLPPKYRTGKQAEEDRAREEEDQFKLDNPHLKDIVGRSKVGANEPQPGPEHDPNYRTVGIRG